jgi:hypothetical protein
MFNLLLEVIHYQKVLFLVCKLSINKNISSVLEILKDQRVISHQHLQLHQHNINDKNLIIMYQIHKSSNKNKKY